MTDGDLRLLFAPFDTVVRAQVARTEMGLFLRFGYVEMEQPDQADFWGVCCTGRGFARSRFTLVMHGTTVHHTHSHPHGH